MTITDDTLRKFKRIKAEAVVMGFTVNDHEDLLNLMEKLWRISRETGTLDKLLIRLTQKGL